MEFVTFHADLSGKTKSSNPGLKSHSTSYSRMVDLLFRSARLSDPAAHCTLLTDVGTLLPDLSAKHRRVDGSIDHSALMLSRTNAQLDYLERSDFAQPIALIDSDILVNRSLDAVFEHDFDVAVTWRTSFNMPINGGLLILNNCRPMAVREFFRRFASIYREKYADSSAWYGDQLALRDCVDLHHRDMANMAVVEQGGCRILLLSCDTYNYSPELGLESIDTDMPHKAILHFKGQRKHLMEPFFHNWLEPRYAQSAARQSRAPSPAAENGAGR